MLTRRRPAAPLASLPLLLAALRPAPARAADVPVADVPALLAAIAAAQPGDTILLAPGTYAIQQSKIACNAAGAPGAPIVVRAAQPGTVHLELDSLEGFHVRGPYWEFADLDIKGVCPDDSACEHAFHITGAADRAHIHHNRLHGFNAQIKANGEPIGPGDAYVWPDDVVVEYNEFFNEAPRQTANPVTPIDVVGGQRWTIRGNYIHDHAKAGGNTISYAAFLKGHSKDGLIERNLVVCELLHSGQIRLGLSLGGGGTSPDAICEDGACKPEHERGLLRNNLIVNCPADVGIYVNAAADSRILHNTLYNTTGIDMRFPETTGLVQGNLLAGKIRDRDGALTDKAHNLTDLTLAQFAAWFGDPAALDFTLKDGAALKDLAVPHPDLPDDYCANLRDDPAPDIGAIEYDRDACPGGLPLDPGGATDSGPDSDSDSGTDSDATTGATTDATTAASDSTSTAATTDPSETTAASDTTASTTAASAPTATDPTATDPTAASDTASDTLGADDPAGCACRHAPTPQLPAALALLTLLALTRRRP